MGKKLLFFLSAVFSLLFAIIIFSYLSGASESSSKVDTKVLQNIQDSGGKTRVIVLMKDISSSQGMSVQDAKNSYRAQAISSIGREKVGHEFSSFNGFSASITDSELNSLQNNPNVERIYYDEPVHAFLQDSAPLVNATQSWSLKSLGINSGVNLTGAGETICIIDTGINYSHVDLGNCTIARYPMNGTNESYVLESVHNYSNSFDYTWNITRPGYSQIALHFANISLEFQGQVSGADSYDRIIIYNSNMTEIASYHGANGTINDTWTPYSEGNTIYVRLKTDTSVTSYGFYIDLVRNGTTNTTYNWSSCSKVAGGWNFVNNTGDPYDDHGHGTHVAGIAAANGTLKGAAPDARIISAKALDSAGNGWSSDIVYAIEYCTNISTAYNVSVISMSLGGSTKYTAYCDSSDTFTAAAINKAYAKNISIIVSSGNNGWSDGITSPACIQNATPVSATNKSDSIDTSYANRNSLVKLFAPGTAINSTWKTGGYSSQQGTSMSAPHVSGVYAIISQYLRATGRTKTPKEIETIFNNTGKIIIDTTGINYSRINIYAAILSLDNAAPNVTLVSPSNGMATMNTSINFACNATDWQLANISFYLWNSTSLYYNETKNATGTFNETIFNLANITSGSYSWNCLGRDSQSNSAFALSNFTFGVGDFVAVNLVSPTNAFRTRQAIVNFTCNATSQLTNLTNLTFYLWNSTSSIINQTFFNASSLSNQTSLAVNFTSLSDGNYSWNCLASNNASSNFASANSTLIYDVLSPSITIVSPGNNSWQNALRFNLTLNEAGMCLFSYNNQANITMTNTSSTAFNYTNSTINETSASNLYNVTFYCNDTAGNSNSTAVVFFGIDKTNPAATLSSPADSYSTTSTSLDFSAVVTDNINVSTCRLIFDGSVSSTNTVSSNSTTTTFTKSSISVASHSWSINCTDSAGNIGNTSSRSLTITSSSSDSSPSGGGADSSTQSAETQTAAEAEPAQTYIAPAAEISSEEGYTRSLAQGDQATFTLSRSPSESHSIFVNRILVYSVEIIIKSDPLKVIIGIDEEIRLNVNNASSTDYNLYIKLNDITNNKANLTIREINPLNLTAGNLSSAEAEKKTGIISGEALGEIKDKISNVFSSVYDYIVKYWIYFAAGTGVLVIVIASIIVIRRVRHGKKYGNLRERKENIKVVKYSDTKKSKMNIP